MVYKVVLVSGVQQSDLVIPTSILVWFVCLFVCFSENEMATHSSILA